MSLPHGSADRNPLLDSGYAVGTAGAKVAPSRERGSKLPPVVKRPSPGVAPSRERGSKHDDFRLDEPIMSGRSLTGARIETSQSWRALVLISVAPSRERGSKQNHGIAAQSESGSLPHGSADRNRAGRAPMALDCGRSLTGARIETAYAAEVKRRCTVAPSRERGSKPWLGCTRAA